MEQTEYKKPQWTDDQLLAISTRDKSLLVSAAAGSGKTATLTERIITSLVSGESDLSRLLIVTFTRSAAADMRKKIAKELNIALLADPKNQNLIRQTMLLGSARICTIDSFCYDLVKSNFSKLDISRTIRIADEAEIDILYTEEMKALIKEYYGISPDFPKTVECLTTEKSTNNVHEILLRIYNKVASLPEGIDILDSMRKEQEEIAEKGLFSTTMGQTLQENIRKVFLYAQDLYNKGIDAINACEDPKPRENYLPLFQSDLAFVESVLSLLDPGDYEKLRAAFKGYTPLTAKATRNSIGPIRHMKDTREHLRKIYQNFLDDYFRFSMDEVSALASQTARICECIHGLFARFEERIREEKKRRNIIGFSDLRRMALSLLVQKDGTPTPLALSYHDKFDQIYIDEYQDVDRVQDMIFSALARPGSRFLVGDVKQSIYLFRGADCSVFSDYRAAFPPLSEYKGEEGATIFMSENFRCDRNVINFSNLVSDYMFTHCGNAIPYSDKDALRYGKKQEGYVSAPVQLAVVSGKATEESAQYDMQALYIAREIRRLVDSGKVTDKNEPLTYSHIAILMRSKKHIPEIRAALDAYHIPCVSIEEPNFFENPDVLLVLSLLSTLDNPRSDISLSGVLRSPLYGFSMDQLINIRLASDKSLSLFDAVVAYGENENELGSKCRNFVTDLSHYRQKAQELSVSALMKLLYREKSLLAFAQNSTDNLTRFYEYARVFESGGYKGLYHFIRHIEKIIENKKTLRKNDTGPVRNAVKIVSIHASKGLEYPVCFLYNVGEHFNTEDLGRPFLLESDTGFSVKLPDDSGFGQMVSPMHNIIADAMKKSQVKEEMRILYVAMTRAQSYLYLVAKATNWEKYYKDKTTGSFMDADYTVQHATSYLDWILPALDKAEDKSSFEIKEYSHEELLAGLDEIPDTIEVPDEAQAEDENVQSGTNASLAKTLSDRFSSDYSFRHLSELPAKLSVSKLFPQVLDEGQELDAEIREEDFVLPETLGELAGQTAAEKGTATHTFLQFCDFDRVVTHGVREELDRLSNEKFIDERMSSLVDLRQLETFFESDFFRQIRCASKVYREQRFNLFLPASQFTNISKKKDLLKDEQIAVQGVIDIFFFDENGDLILADYKTDALTWEERRNPSLAAAKLIGRHRQQLYYYAEALEKMCDKKPKKTLIYSLPLGDTIEVKLD